MNNLYSSLTNKKFIYILLIILGLFVLFSFVIKGTRSVGTATGYEFINCENNYSECLQKAQEAIRNEAYAFYYRKRAFQYDNTMITFQPAGDYTEYGTNKRRSNYMHSPEDATTQDIKYLECDAFVNNVYYNAFVDKDDENNHYLLNYVEADNKNYWWADALANSACGSNGIKSNYDGVYCIYHVKEYNDNNEITSSKWYKSTSSNTKIEIENAVENNVVSDALKNDIKSIIQPGDLIIYTYDGGNHAMMYLGGDDYEVMQSTSTTNVSGGSYQFAKKYDGLDPNGTINIINLDENVLIAKKSKTKDKVIFDESTNKIAIIRPLKKILTENKYKISSTTAKRADFPNLVSTKYASVSKHESVNINDEIVYTIKLENRSKEEYANIEVNDVLPEGTVLVSSTEKYNYNNNDGNLSWIINRITSSSSVSITYRVKVTGGLGSKIVSDKTTVNGIKLNTIETVVNKTLTKQLQNRIIEVFNIKKNGTYNDSGSFIQEIYNNIFNNVGFSFSNVSVDNVLSTFYSTNTTLDIDSFYTGRTKPTPLKSNNDTGIKTIYQLKNQFTNNQFKKMYLENMFGGIYTKTVAETSENPMREDGRELTFNIDSLLIGDVLIVVDDDYQIDGVDAISNDSVAPKYIVNEKNMYLYLGDGKFATIDNDKKVVVFDKYEINTIKRLFYSRLIDSLLAQNTFIALRPSYAINYAIPTESIEVMADRDGGEFINSNIDNWQIDTNDNMKNNSFRSFDVYGKDGNLPYGKKENNIIVNWIGETINIGKEELEQGYIDLSYGLNTEVLPEEEPSPKHYKRLRTKNLYPVVPKVKYTIIVKNDENVNNNLVVNNIIYYDKNYRFVGTQSNSSKKVTFTFTVPQEAYFMKFVLLNTAVSDESSVNFENAETVFLIDSLPNNIRVALTPNIDANTPLLSINDHTIYPQWGGELLYFTSNKYSIDYDKGLIYKISPNTNYSIFKSNINTNGIYKIVNKGSNDLVKTGDILTVTYNGEIFNYTLYVLGDINNDGVSDIEDAKNIAEFILFNPANYGIEYTLCADLNNDGIIKMNDVVLILKNEIENE